MQVSSGKTLHIGYALYLRAVVLRDVRKFTEAFPYFREFACDRADHGRRQHTPCAWEVGELQRLLGQHEDSIIPSRRLLYCPGQHFLTMTPHERRKPLITVPLLCSRCTAQVMLDSGDIEGALTLVEARVYPHCVVYWGQAPTSAIQ